MGIKNKIIFWIVIGIIIAIIIWKYYFKSNISKLKDKINKYYSTKHNVNINNIKKNANVNGNANGMTIKSSEMDEREKAFQNYLNNIKQKNDTLNQALMYHHGTTDLNGNTIITPDANKSIELYYKYVEMGGNPNVLFNVVDIYAYGIHNFESTPERIKKAIDICNYIIKTYNGLDDIAMKKKRLLRMQFARELDEISKNGGNIGGVDANIEDAVANDEENIGEDNDEQEIRHNNQFYLGVPGAIGGRGRGRRTIRNGMQGIMNDLLNYNLGTVDTPDINQIRMDLENVGRLENLQRELNNIVDGNLVNDINNLPGNQQVRVANSQNVHDSAIGATVSKSINNLENITPIRISKEVGLNQIRKLIRQTTDTDKRQKALQTLDSIERTGMPTKLAGGKNILLSDCLNLIWNRINQSPEENQDNLKSNLVNELSESVEHGSVVCTQGKLTRIVDTLNLVDPAVKIVPKNLLNEELVLKAKKIKDSVYNKLNETEKKAVDNPEPNKEEQTINENYEREVKKTIREEINKDYANTEIAGEINNNLNKWIDTIF